MELKSSNFTSVGYHNIFDFKLTKEELVKWQYKNKKEKVSGVKNKSRLQREKYSKNKLIIAKKASKLISKISTVKFVGVTGALAMNNADINGDIDFMIITKVNSLWLTRSIVYILLWVFGFKSRISFENNLNNKSVFEYTVALFEILRTRDFRIKEEKDRLCTNMWLDESDLVWEVKDRNLYTAHEIAQVVPLFNKDNTYEKFLWNNKWILEYWPNAVSIQKYKEVKMLYKGASIVEKVAFKLQYLYMKNKITREVITPTRAIFHPNDWGKVVLRKLKS